MTFVKAQRKRAKLRLGLVGPSGSGKTWTGLAIATGMVSPGKRIAVIDSERESASLYANDFDFDVCALKAFSPSDYVKAIHEAERAGYEVIVIDSLSHAWNGTGGALEMVDAAMARSRGKKFAAWREVTPEHNDLVNAMLQSPAHIIATMRAVTEYVLEPDEKGKQVPKKVGLKPVQRDGMEYEFTAVFDIDAEHRAMPSKTRASFLDGAVIRKPGAKLGQDLIAWLNSGAADAPQQRPTEPTGGVSLFSPPADVPSRAASSGPSNGGAPLPTPTAEVKAAIEAAFPGAEVGEPRYADDFLKAEFKRFATDFGKEWCQGFGTTKGLDAEGRAKLYERMKAEAQRLDTLSVDEWKLYAVELDKVKVGLAEEVWASVMPEKVASIEEAHVVQIDRLYKAADKALGDVPL